MRATPAATARQTLAGVGSGNGTRIPAGYGTA